jgi:hypothetical protein
MMVSMAERRAQRSSRKRPSTRLVMSTVAVGALLILGISAGLSRPGGGDRLSTGASGRKGASPAPALVNSANPGDCLDWTAPDASDIHQVPCAQPHLFEITGRTSLRSDFAVRSPFPDTEQWQQLKQDRCAQVSLRFLGGRLDPKGRFSVGAFTPSGQGWKSGDRTLHCGLQQPGPSGKLYRFTGNVANLDQSDIYPTGQCLGINGTAVADPVADCGRPHSVEITGAVNLGEHSRSGYPSDSDQDGLLATQCAALTDQYAGSPGTATGKGLIAYWDTLSRESWETGSRQVNCKVSAQLPDGSGLAPLIGSIKGTVQVGRTAAPEDPHPGQAGIPATEPW